MALNPQITKTYANNDINKMTELIFLGSKFTAYMTFFFAIPLIAETDYILSIWLKNVPEYSAVFVRLGLIATIIDKIGMTCSTAYSATGQIKDYVIRVSLAGCLVFPLTLVCFLLGLNAESAYWSFIVTYIIVNIVRLYMMKRRFCFPVARFMYEVVGKILMTLLPCIIFPVIIVNVMDYSFLRLFTNIVVCTMSTAAFVYILGLSAKEQESIKVFVKNKVKNIK